MRTTRLQDGRGAAGLPRRDNEAWAAVPACLAYISHPSVKVPIGAISPASCKRRVRGVCRAFHRAPQHNFSLVRSTSKMCSRFARTYGSTVCLHSLVNLIPGFALAFFAGWTFINVGSTICFDTTHAAISLWPEL
ncbi:hypothetical protein BV20DRAFT_973041 [Pilatotrama ljubarskyi]|nr:hypothetical protein BV20DRAFT_973041 [Pilatotrama ljubarskyi]